MEERTEPVEVKLSNGSVIYIESVVMPGVEDISAFDTVSFDEISAAIEGVAESILASLRKVKPRKASVEFGIEVTAGTGRLTTMIVKGAGNANLKVTLEWGS
jgi:hypothetical protein